MPLFIDVIHSGHPRRHSLKRYLSVPNNHLAGIKCRSSLHTEKNKSMNREGVNPTVHEGQINGLLETNKIVGDQNWGKGGYRMDGAAVLDGQRM